VKREEVINGFVQLGKLMVALGKNEDWNGFSSGVTREEYEVLNNVINRQAAYNGWFKKENVQKSLFALGSQLTNEQLNNWTEEYSYSANNKKVALIMAGNIPIVGFHDFLCVLISGNTAVCKLSSDDKTLLPALAHHLIQFLPEIKERIIFTTGRIGEMDAVIATGSDNSLHYFKQYFGHYPNIFRHNRTSIALITGNETKEEFNSLGNDIFDYFGLGCRNVSYLLIPKGFDLNRFFEGIISHSEVVNHHKYANNYDYNKAVYLLNQQELLDNHFVLLRESKDLFGPLSMIHYQYYENQDEVAAFLTLHKDQIQAIVGHNNIPFGQSQSPRLNDYADGIDTMKFLESLIV
jgi:hypothetical protein